MNVLTSAVLDHAALFIGTKEVGHNRGILVERWQALAGGVPGDPWCMAFVYSMFHEAAETLAVANPCPRTMGALRLWKLAPSWAMFSAPSPGAIFVIDHGGGHGHVGLVEGVDPEFILTIEGNTNEAGHPDGDGVYRRKRMRSEINVGYVDFGHRPEEPVA